MRRKQHRGYILIQALVAVAGLLALMAILAGDERTSIDGLQGELDQTRAKEAVKGAVAQALAVLSTANENEVTLNDTWATMGSNGSEEFDFSDGTSFRLQVVDASSLINLNTASQTELQTLPLDQDQIDCLLDWIQSGETARTDGAKDTFYNSLPQPYNAKLGALTTVNELLLIDNWTAQTLYQPPLDSSTLNLPTGQDGSILPLAALFTVDSGAPNTSGSGAPLINLTSVSPLNARRLTALGLSAALATRIAARSFTSFRTLFAAIPMSLQNESIVMNAVTFTTGTRTTGKINLNTATQAVLETLPALSSAQASTIVSTQSTAYPTLGQWALSSGLTSAAVATLADSFTVGSDTWIVRAYGQSGSIGCPEEAVVGYRSGTLQVISVDDLHTPGIPLWWGWNSPTTATEQAGVTQ